MLDISTYKDETSPALVDLGQVDGKTYGVFIKASVKGLIWYNPSLHDYSSSRTGELRRPDLAGHANIGNAQALWCLGIESGDASGWPATDWIEEILLHQAGPDVYNNWWQGKIAWTDPAIKEAFDTYMDVVEQLVRRRDQRGGHGLRRGRRPALRQPARLRALPPGELHHRPRRVR